MALSYLTKVSFFLLLATMELYAQPYTGCARRRDVMIKALYETEYNLNELDRAFYPERFLPSRFIRVNYTIGDCSIMYLWTSGAFLFIQAPKIFDFTSLLFSYNSNYLKEIKLKLPEECMDLVEANCSCKERGILERLTQQLDVLSKFDDPTSVDRGTATSARAVCYDNNILQSRYFKHRGVMLYLLFTLTSPIVLMIILAVTIRSARTTIHEKFVKSRESHANLVGITVTLSYVHFFVLILDICAVHYFKNENDDSEFNVKGDHITTKSEFSFYIIYITMGLNLIVSFMQTLYILICFADKSKWCSRPYFYIIFGRGLLEHEIWKDEAKNSRQVWLIIGLLFAPLFCIGSHAGYIAMAWVTEPSKTTKSFLGVLACILFLFLVFRQCYIAHTTEDNEELCTLSWKKNNKLSVICYSGNNFLTKCFSLKNKCGLCLLILFPLTPILFLSSHASNIYYLCCKHMQKSKAKPVPQVSERTALVSSRKEESNTKNESTTEEKSTSKNGSTTEEGSTSKKDYDFNTRSFFIVFCWGFYVIGYLALAVAAFFLIPLYTAPLTEYIESLVQIIIVLVGFMISYKFLSVEDTDIRKFIRKLRFCYRGRRDNNLEVSGNEDDDAEAVGAIAAELAYKLIQPSKPSKPSKPSTTTAPHPLSETSFSININTD